MNNADRAEPNALAHQVKATLMQARREGWKEVKWSLLLKRVLAEHPNETCDLAEILLQQAMVGSSANELFISYLKHAVLSQVIPYCSVFKHIATFEDFSRPYRILTLVDLAESFAKCIDYSNGQDWLELSKAMLSLVHWLLLCVLKCLQHVGEGKTVPTEVHIMEAASQATQTILASTTICGLLQVARADIAESYREFEQTELNVRGTLSQLTQNAIPPKTREKILAALTTCSQLQECQVNTEPLLGGQENLCVCSTINGLVAIEAVLNPTSDTQPFIHQIIVLAKLLKMSWPNVYCEMFRACFMGIIDSTEKPAELQWAAFTFLKMPQILQKIKQQTSTVDQAQDLERALNQFLTLRSLLNITDTKQKNDCLTQLLHELNRFKLINDAQKSSLLQKRAEQGMVRTEGQGVNPGKSGLITRAELTVTSILKTLDADYQKNQESLVGMLRQMLSRRSFEIILAAAAPMGELGNFTVKLIKMNEFARQQSGEGHKAALPRAMLFDITFLMLCHICQTYGPEIVGNAKEAQDSFMMQWVQRWLPEDGKYRNMEALSPTDSSKVDMLLREFTSGNDIRTNQTRWHEVCLNTPFAVQEVLYAYENGVTTFDNVRMFLDAIKTRMSALTVVTCVWLCSYMNTLASDAREKPMALLEHLYKAPTDQAVLNESKTHLMMTVMEKVMNPILPPGHRLCAAQQDPLPPNQVPPHILQKTLETVFQKGWMTLRTLHHLEKLLDLCGPDWFADQVTMNMVDSSKKCELVRALHMVVAIFHLDLEPLTLRLLSVTLPRLIHSHHLNPVLGHPRGYVLARLAIAVIIATQSARIDHREPFVRRGVKRHRMDLDDDMEEMEARPSRARRLTEPQLTLQSDEFNFDDITVREDGETSPTFESREPINKALANLFQLLNAIVTEGIISPRLDFIFSFVEETIKCGPQYSRYILQYMPPNMLLQLQKIRPGYFSNAQILQICDLSTTSGRKMAVKAIFHNSRVKTEPPVPVVPVAAFSRSISSSSQA